MIYNGFECVCFIVFFCFVLQEEIGRYKKLYNEVLIERNQFKQQCTQVIRQWDEDLREKNKYKDALAKVRKFSSNTFLENIHSTHYMYV